jgi:hypothetical protein
MDDDPLFRVPFRDAVAQANAELRAGLGCAHVDLPKLPRAVLDLCAAASRPNSTTQVAEAMPAEPIRGGLDDRWTFNPSADVGGGPDCQQTSPTYNAEPANELPTHPAPGRNCDQFTAAGRANSLRGPDFSASP